MAAPPLTSPPTPPAPKVLAAWNSIDKGFFFTFSDGADGTLTADKTYAAQKQAQFAGASVILLDNGALVLGTIQNSKLNVIAALSEVNSSDLTFIVGQSKSADGKTFVDGAVYAATDLKTAGFSGNVLEVGADGKSSKTTHIELDLAVPGTTPPSMGTGQ